MNSRRLIAAQRSGQSIVTVQTRLVKGRPDVRFGSKADICSAKPDVRFTPNSNRKSRHLPKAMSALPPKATEIADMAGMIEGTTSAILSDLS
jgi:hypothetical protein